MGYFITAMLLCLCMEFIMSPEVTAHRGLNHRHHHVKREANPQAASSNNLGNPNPTQLGGNPIPEQWVTLSEISDQWVTIFNTQSFTISATSNPIVYPTEDPQAETSDDLGNPNPTQLGGNPMPVQTETLNSISGQWVPITNTQSFQISATPKPIANSIETTASVQTTETTATVQTTAAGVSAIANSSHALSLLLTSYDMYWTEAYMACKPPAPLGAGTRCNCTVAIEYWNDCQNHCSPCAKALLTGMLSNMTCAGVLATNSSANLLDLGMYSFTANGTPESHSTLRWTYNDPDVPDAFVHENCWPYASVPQQCAVYWGNAIGVCSQVNSHECCTMLTAYLNSSCSDAGIDEVEVEVQFIMDQQNCTEPP